MNFQNMVEVRNINKKIVAPAFGRAGLDDICSTIEMCGDYSKVYECCDCHTQEYKSVATCHNKFCLLCNTIKSRHWLGRLYEALEKMLFDGKYIVMLTFTIRDTPTLEEGVRVLNNAWRMFTNTVKSCRADFHSRWIGGVKSLEVKTGKNSGQWHPHLHCLMVKDHFSYDEIYLNGTADGNYMSAWRYCVQEAGGGENNGHVDIESLYCRTHNGEKIILSQKRNKRTNINALASGIVESVKYISKFDYSQESPDRLRELVNGLYGVRQIDTYGILKDLAKKVEKDMENDTDSGTVEHLCKMCGYNEAFIVGMLTDNVINNKTSKLLIKDDFRLGQPLDEQLKHNVKVFNGVVKPKTIVAGSPQLSMFEEDNYIFKIKE